ncbi:hypothetical protein GE061_013878 [Apolygus lucorum]|uniref:Uncharacterized protein n=1 Tax=Apolygus lucorum TaxID=248454 RepID=A0A8S9XP88_APOLU|nr:hypothetical protein GE061_013878 [Apolygus lucorum]
MKRKTAGRTRSSEPTDHRLLKATSPGMALTPWRHSAEPVTSHWGVTRRTREGFADGRDEVSQEVRDRRGGTTDTERSELAAPRGVVRGWARSRREGAEG